MKIQILGKGCQKCELLEQNTRKAVENLGLEATIEKVTDSDQIMEMGVMMTPAIAVDGAVKKSGRVLTPKQIEDILAG